MDRKAKEHLKDCIFVYFDISRVEVDEIDSELSENHSDIASEKESTCHLDTGM